MCRGKLASGIPAGNENIQDVLSLFKELEEKDYLGIDQLKTLKEILKSVREWALFGKVRNFERKRKEYSRLLEEIIQVLDELNDMERLMSMCRGKIPEGNEGNIQDVRRLLKELENQDHLEIDQLDVLKEILTETDKKDLLKKVEEFEKRRNDEEELESRKAAVVSTVRAAGESIVGEVKIHCTFRKISGVILVVGTGAILHRCSKLEDFVQAFGVAVLPAAAALRAISEGSVCFTVQLENKSALESLWEGYQDGTLQRNLQQFLVTDEIRQLADGEEVILSVYIDGQELKKTSLNLSTTQTQETGSIGDGKIIRRNSDSAVYFRTKEELPLLKVNEHADTELNLLKQRIVVVEREIKQLSPEALGSCSPEDKATFLKQRERWKAREAGEMDERTVEPEISQRHKVKLMDPGKFAFVQKYLEDVQDTRSMTTEESDSGLVTHTAASELGNEEISETNKLCLKDLSSDVTRELLTRLEADEAAKEKFYRFFGLKVRSRHTLARSLADGLTLTALTDIEHLFPDTTVNVLKESFEALQLYDLAELLEKVRPRSLRPALPPEQIEKLRRTDDRLTKYHSDVSVLVVNHSFKEDNVVMEYAEKIEAFFKNLNSRNEVAIIASPNSQETRQVLWEMTQKKQKEEILRVYKETIRHQLEIELPRERERLEKKMEMEDEGKLRVGFSERGHGQSLSALSAIKREELGLRRELDIRMEKAAKLREQIEQDIEMMKELEKNTEKAISSAVDKWIHNQEKFTCVAVFVISDALGLDDYTEAILDECVVEKLVLLPGHAKLVVSPSWWKSIDKVPQTLHVTYPVHEGMHESLSVVTLMIEIFNKRWQTLDLISMMQELKRTFSFKWHSFDRHDHFAIQDSLSTLPTFQKKGEDSLSYMK